MLTDTHIQFFRSNGYLVIDQLLPFDLCDAVIDTILDNIDVDIDDASTWYRGDLTGHGIIPLHHAQALWDVRQYPDVHAVFAQLYETEKLWVSNDRVSYKPPAGVHTKSWQPGPVHWDCDPWSFQGLSIQGLVYLSETSEQQGAFMCVPEIYRNLQQYLTDHAEDEHRQYPKVTEAELTSVGGSKGSLVVFNRLLPHTSGRNATRQHRFVQYVTMLIAADEDRARVVGEWREKLLPDWAIKQTVSKGRSHEPGEPARLTDHGRKLVGLDPW